MQVIDWRQFLKDGLPCGEKLSSVTIGVFDGVHRGHKSLIEKIVSHNSDCTPVVITFRQNHKTEKHAQKNIQSLRQKTIAFESLGVKITLVIDFTESFMHIPGMEFLEILLKHGKPGFMAVGSGFRCGYKLDTDAAAIQNLFAGHDIPVEIAPQIIEGSIPVSSSRIRAAITDGDLTLARAMLGRPYSIDLAALAGLVLPPPGRYNVLLKKKPEDEGTNAAISIEKGDVRIPENLARSRWEFAEFLA